MAEHLRHMQAEIRHYQQLLAQAENTGILEAIREAQERLARVLRVQAVLLRER